MAINWTNVSGLSDRAGGQILRNATNTANVGGQQIVDTLDQLGEQQNAEQSLAFKELLASARTPEELEAIRPQLDNMRASMTTGARENLVGAGDARLQTINAAALNELNRNELTRAFGLREEQEREAPVLGAIEAAQIDGKDKELTERLIQQHRIDFPNSPHLGAIAKNQMALNVAQTAAGRASEAHAAEMAEKFGNRLKLQTDNFEKAEKLYAESLAPKGIGSAEGEAAVAKALLAIPDEDARISIAAALGQATSNNEELLNLPTEMVVSLLKSKIGKGGILEDITFWNPGSSGKGLQGELNKLLDTTKYKNYALAQEAAKGTAAANLRDMLSNYEMAQYPPGTIEKAQQDRTLRRLGNEYNNRTRRRPDIVPPTNTEEPSGTPPAVNNVSKIDNAAAGTELGDFRRTGTQLDNAKKTLAFPWTRRIIGNAFNTGNNAIMDAGEQLARQVFNAAPNSAKAKKNILISLGAPKSIVPAKSPSEFREQLAQWENRKAIKPQRELKYGDEGFGLGNVRR